MNKTNMERCINNWILCPSKSLPGKFYYFNVLTGEAAWTLNEMENTRAMPKNSYIEKVNKWHTYPEPDSPPDDRYMPEPSWRRKPDQCLFSRPTMPIFGQPAFPVYHSYMEPHLHNTMQNPTPIGSGFIGDVKRLQNMWGRDRDSNFLNTDMDKRFVRYEKPGMFNANCTSTPTKDQWLYNFKNSGAVPIFGQIPSKMTARMFESKPRANLIKRPMFGQKRIQSDSPLLDNEDNIFRTKSTNNLQSLHDSAYLDKTLPSEHTSNKYTPNISVFQTGRIFGTKSYEDLQTVDDSGYFEMRKPKSAVQKNIFMAQPERNVKVTEQISNENACSSNDLKSNLNWRPRKRQQSVLTGPEKADKGEANTGKTKLLHELGEADLRFILMAKRKKLDNPKQDRTGTKVKTSYSKANVSPPVKKRVTFDIDVLSDDTDKDVPGDEKELPATDQPEDEQVSDDEQECVEALDIRALKSLAKLQSRSDVWYIAVDTEVLLEDFEFIATFVQADSKCRLLVPIAVRQQVDALTAGDCRGRQRVIAARHLARKIASPPGYVTVQTAEEYDSGSSVSESILNCCLRAMEQRYHVVLISNDTTLCEKANSIGILCFTLQEIKDGASAPKPEVSFNIRKIINLDGKKEKERQNQFTSESTSLNRVRLNNRSETPVNCFKKRLFAEQKIENTKYDGLFFQSDDRNFVCDSNDIRKTNQTTKRFADCEKFQAKDVFAPKNYRDTFKESSDTSANTSEIRQIQENIQNLIIEDAPRNNLIQKDVRSTKPDSGRNKMNITEQNPTEDFHNNDAKTEETKVVTKKKKLKSINGYTIQQHLKRFDVKTKLVEDRIKTRMDEWICSFSQIMEDGLSYTLQEYCGSQSALAPPWSLAEAVECIRDVYGDNSSVRVLVERLSALLYSCSCKKGKLSLEMKPKDFMTIFGLGILLIQCLKTVIPKQSELRNAEEALLALLRLVTEPGVEPAPPEPGPAPTVSASTELVDRKNFVKKPSEVIEYLRRHYPEWKSYREKDEAALQQEMDQLKEKGKRLNNIVRTFGKDLHSLKIENNKAISFGKTNNDDISAKKDERTHVNEAHKTKKSKVDVTDLDDIETESACDKAIRATGAKLLRKLALNSLHRLPKLKNIDVEKRDKSGKELVCMINEMTGDNNEQVTEQKTAPINDGNNNTDQVNNANRTLTDTEPKFIRKFSNFTIVKLNSHYVGDKNKKKPVEDAPKENINDTKHKSPKILRNFNALLTNKDKNFKSSEKLDLDALDYDVDYSEEDDTSQMTIENEGDHDDAEATCDDVAKNHEAVHKQNDEESPQNDNGNAEEQVNENVETDTTNDSGFENDSLHAYTLAKTCLTEISETLKSVYRFVSSVAAKFRVGRMSGDVKVALHQKTNESLKMLADIIDCLKCIVARESNERTSMRAVLLKAGGVEAANDKRIMRYKQVVSKYLEQARLLEEALRVVLAAAAPAASPALSVSSLSSDIKYINIFE